MQQLPSAAGKRVHNRPTSVGKNGRVIQAAGPSAATVERPIDPAAFSAGKRALPDAVSPFTQPSRREGRDGRCLPCGRGDVISRKALGGRTSARLAGQTLPQLHSLVQIGRELARFC